MSRLAFGHTEDDFFLVTVGTVPGRGIGASGMSQAMDFRVTAFDSEDAFLGLVVTSSLTEQEISEIVHGVLLTINKPSWPQRWVEVKLNETLARELRLDGVTGAEFPVASVGQIHDLFMQAPTPLMVLMGAEHRYRFVNDPYLEIMGRTRESVMGRTIREVYPEMKGQPFFGLLDTVFRTGVPYVGKEQVCRFVGEESGAWEERNFDFIYQPIRGALGEVEGIMVQATDVTQAVLARQVSEDRERQLFRQWTELQSIYRTAPTGLALLDATDFRFLRVNQRTGIMMGCEAEDLLGRPVLEVVPQVVGLREVLERVAAGEAVLGVEIEGELSTSPGVHRSWNLDATPIFDANGRVSAITTLGTETTDQKLAAARMMEGEKQVVVGVLAETIVGQVARPLENLRILLDVVRSEIRRPEAHEALEAADRELRRVVGVIEGMKREYGVPIEIREMADADRR